MSGTKRPPEDPMGGQNNHGHHGPPPSKKKLVVEVEAPRGGPVASLEEMDIRVLQFQHRKMREKLASRQKQEEEMRERIEQLEIRQTQDDAVLNVINRYWSQLNEDIGLLLQRFDTSSKLWGSPSDYCSEAATSFLTQLSTWDKEELDSKLVQRVEMSTKAVEKIIEAFDRLQNRNEKVMKALECTDSPDLLQEALKEANIELQHENRQLEAVNNHLHEQFRAMSLKRKELDENLSAEETKTDELKEKVEDLEWEVSKMVAHNDKLINHIQEIAEKYRRLQQAVSSEEPSTSSGIVKPCIPVEAPVSDRDVRNLQKDNEELKELANHRLSELESLHHLHKDTLKELERLRMEIKNLPESVIVETPAYKLLQSKFSVMYNESNHLRTSFEDARQSAAHLRSQQLKHNEHMESEELLMQKKLRTEMIQLEDMLCQVRQEYEMLRIEFEQNLTANEQTGPINREMRKLITSLQNHNQQLKGDATRSRRRYKEISLEMSKLKKERDNIDAQLNAFIEKDRVRRASRESEVGVKEEDSPISSTGDLPQPPQPQITDLTESSNDAPSSASAIPGPSSNSSGKPVIISEKKVDVEALAICEKDQDLKLQLSKTLVEQRETKLLLDMYKGSGKDQRDRAQLVSAEKKTRHELEELRHAVKRYEDSRREEKKKLADVDAVKKIKALEEEVQTLQKSLATQKAEEEALIAEMEVTGQAFEEMQDQNGRLVTQLRERDDANFKLLSERVKSSTLHKVSKDELNTLQNQLQTLAQRVDSQNMVVRKLEEKEMLVVNTISAMEKEGSVRLQASEGYKRKAVETAQSAYELTLHLEKYHKQMKDAQETVSVKTTALEAEAFKTKKLQEEIMGLRRKVERLNKIEMAGNSDEIMTEEIREYKETLTCPSCKVKRKDAVLTKCFHVFCFDCLRTRYETRQRKCPKCNAGFGANDYHRLYLT